MFGAQSSQFSLGASASLEINIGRRYGSQQRWTRYRGCAKSRRVDKTFDEFEICSALSTSSLNKDRSESLSHQQLTLSGSKAVHGTMSTPQNLWQLLDRAVQDAPFNCITIYNPEGRKGYFSDFSTYDSASKTTKLTYSRLQQNTQQESIAIQGLLQMNENKIDLLHVGNRLDGVHWFWAIVTAGGIPCL